MLKPFSLGRKLFRDISKNQGGLNYLDYDRFMGKVWKESIFLTDIYWTALREIFIFFNSAYKHGMKMYLAVTMSLQRSITSKTFKMSST